MTIKQVNVTLGILVIPVIAAASLHAMDWLLEQMLYEVLELAIDTIVLLITSLLELVISYLECIFTGAPKP